MRWVDGPRAIGGGALNACSLYSQISSSLVGLEAVDADIASEHLVCVRGGALPNGREGWGEDLGNLERESFNCVARR